MIVYEGGQLERAEFSEIVREVKAISDRYGATLVKSEQIQPDRGLRNVDFIFLFRSFPHEFLQSDVEGFRRISPLAPIVVIAGKFCEGEEYHGELLPGTRRFYVDDWRSFGREEFENFFQGKGLFMESPLTPTSALQKYRISSRQEGAVRGSVLLLTDDERIATLCRETIPEESLCAVDGLFSANEEGALRLNKEPTRIVVDVAELSDRRLPEKIVELCKLYPLATITLWGFAPTESERRAFQTSEFEGRVNVVAKPFNLCDLF
ncbi:MAG: hypothetical protein ACI4NP_06055 [Thermoguttaceae bacterium]